MLSPKLPMALPKALPLPGTEFLREVAWGWLKRQERGREERQHRLGESLPAGSCHLAVRAGRAARTAGKQRPPVAGAPRPGKLDFLPGTQGHRAQVPGSSCGHQSSGVPGPRVPGHPQLVPLSKVLRLASCHSRKIFKHLLNEPEWLWWSLAQGPGHWSWRGPMLGSLCRPFSPV